MYAWYENAEICYAYLADVKMVEDEHGNWENSRAEFRHSAWFTRGWTLQELLAPKQVLFLDRDWAYIGIKGELYDNWYARILNTDISFATGIKEIDLSDPQEACVARKFSWLSRRETTRVEDMAYCMLGLYNVNMPLLYGEGEKAFARLQMEIIKSSDDESIFAWFDEDDAVQRSILAWSPRDFGRSGSIHRGPAIPGKLPYSMTNKGLQYQVPRAKPRQSKDYEGGEKYELLLECGAENESGELIKSSLITIDLEFSGWRWYRCQFGTMELSSETRWTEIVESENCVYETLYIAAEL